MNDRELQELAASSPVPWVDLNHMVTENQHPIEFTDHRFLIDLYADMHPDIVVIKSAQVGESVERILKSFWAAKYLKANIIYVLPTNNVVKDFVSPKVDPLIESNPVIRNMVSKNSESLKQVGDRFIYFKGAFSEREAIAISGDILILDELDRMPDMRVINTYDSRLQASKLGYRWRLSNPSHVGFGVDALYQDSDQRHWFVKHACGYEWFMDWEPDDKCHYVDKERQIYACGKCGGEITDHERQMGRWIARHPSIYRHGYWISQLIAPWVPASRIIDQFNESNLQFFNNFVLGKAYTPSDLIVNRATILRACAPSIIAKKHVAMGVDQEAGGQFWVAMTPQGVFAHGKTKSWEEIEHLKLMWDATMVIDQMPYPTYPNRLSKQYRDVYTCRFKDLATDNLKWDGDMVWADRTKLLDIIANEITDARLLFRETPYQLEDLIEDFQNLYRTTEEKDDGKIKTVWAKKANAKSDYPFALAYARIALTRILGGRSEFIEAADSSDTPITDSIGKDGRLESTLPSIIEDTFNAMDE